MNINDLPPKYQKQAEAQIGRERAKKAVKKPKYNNTKVTCGNLKFDSKKEKQRYDELMFMQEQGLISGLKLQHNFTLREGYTTPDGERVQGTVYKADFTYYDENGKFIVEDVKSAITKENAVYKLKKKMMMDKGYRINEI